MPVPASMPLTAASVAVVTMMTVAGWRAAVKGSPPAINRLAAAVVADHHSLPGDTAAAVAATGIAGSTSAAAAVSGLSGGWRHDREASSQSEEGKDRFHGVGMVSLFCQAALIAAAPSDVSGLAVIHPVLEKLYPPPVQTL